MLISPSEFKSDANCSTVLNVLVPNICLLTRIKSIILASPSPDESALTIIIYVFPPTVSTSPVPIISLFVRAKLLCVTLAPEVWFKLFKNFSKVVLTCTS